MKKYLQKALVMRLFGETFWLYTLVTIALLTASLAAFFIAILEKIPGEIAGIIATGICVSAFLWLIFGVYILGTAAKKKIKRVLEVSRERRDPQLGIAVYEKVLRRCPPQLKGDRVHFLVILCSFYMQNGEYEKGEAALNQIASILSDKNVMWPTEVKLSYYGCRVLFFLRVKDIAKAAAAMTEYGAFVDMYVTDTNKKWYYDDNYRDYYNKYSLLTGKLDGLEDYYNRNFDTAKDTMGRVLAKYNLAEVYMKSNEREKAKEALQFVADNGNATVYAREARELLAKWN
ncbi:MAG: hypothetical protein FWF49_06050 [Oscillospiraceae bacterium]|nr:hypothetical protein [Oscillospiraceae bacterium]